MTKQECDKIKKLFDDVTDISQRLEKFSIAGEKKKITRHGNSSHITMGIKDLGKTALVIILPDLDKI